MDFQLVVLAEALPAGRIGAAVRSLPGVRALVYPQLARVAVGLLTEVAAVRSLPGVGAAVRAEEVGSSEGFAAVAAAVDLVLAVTPLVGPEGGLTAVGLLTQGAGEHPSGGFCPTWQRRVRDARMVLLPVLQEVVLLSHGGAVLVRGQGEELPALLGQISSITLHPTLLRFQLHKMAALILAFLRSDAAAGDHGNPDDAVAVSGVVFWFGR